MTSCPGTDALATIAGALEWDVEQGIKHLSRCETCASNLHALRSVHEAFDVREEVPESVVASIAGAITQSARRERARGKRVQSLGDVIEATLAGFTALAVVNTGGLEVGAAVNASVFAVVATSLFAYRVLRSSHSTAVRSSSPSIQ
jgi:hypothetical protein